MSEHGTDPPPLSDNVDAIATWQARRLDELMSSGTGSGWLKRRHTPELVKVRERMRAQVDEIRRVLALNSNRVAASVESRLKELLARDPGASDDLDYAWELSDALKLMMPEIGDDQYVGMLLEGERVRDDGKGRLRWRNYLDPGELRALERACREGDVTPAVRERAVSRLVSMYERRRDDGAHYRARVGMQARYFVASASLLAPLVIALGVTTSVVGNVSGWTVMLSAVAGAVGSTLTGALKARGFLRINDLRSAFGWWLMQPLVGASAGLVVLLLLASEIVGLPGASDEATAWAAAAIYSFVGGFSEPFFLGVVSKIAAASEGKTGSAAA